MLPQRAWQLSENLNPKWFLSAFPTSEINKGYGVWYAYGGHRIWCAPEKMPETYYPDNEAVPYSFDGGTLIR